jgi:hypothetical protein
MKFTGKADITEEAVKFIPVLTRMIPLLQQYESSFDNLNIVEGNVLFTVPKKTDIDRCACKEPDINMFLQKGVGNHIRRRLLKHGINLNDQRINRQLAYEGSISDSLMTLDMSSASDLISREVVRVLLPPLWFEYLNDIRSTKTEIDGETTVLEMFSSMGNGFTFELESLIFFALTRSVQYFEGVSGVASIYGDDIIAPSEIFYQLTFVLDKFGFVVNEDKSFHKGPFRESCGGHFYNGEDITPFYLKREPTRLTDLIRVANQLRQWVFNDPFRQYLMPSCFHAWKSLASHVPKGLWGGYDYGLDTKLVSPPMGSHILSRIGVPIKESPLGSYLHWHNTNWNRVLPTEVGSKPVSTNQICRLRRAPKGAPVTTSYFYEEIVTGPDSS